MYGFISKREVFFPLNHLVCVRVCLFQGGCIISIVGHVYTPRKLWHWVTSARMDLSTALCGIG